MSIRHHPSEAVLTAYAAGTLTEGAALIARAHLDVCPACRESARLLEAVGGALIEELPPTDLAPGAVAQVLAAIERPAPPEPPAPPQERRRWLAPGVWLTPLRSPGPGGERTYRLQVPAGMRLPLHSHTGREFIQVVSGAFSDADGRYAPGDFTEGDESDDHHPLIEGGEPCVCLIWTEGPLRMRGLLGKALQPWLGI